LNNISRECYVINNKFEELINKWVLFSRNWVDFEENIEFYLDRKSEKAFLFFNSEAKTI
jgi:hypothetical protein